MTSLQSIKKQYLQDMFKNQYYNNIDILEEAWGMAEKFYKKQFMPKLLKRGNHKLNKNIIIWDLSEIVTCKGACVGCYAVKASRQYKNTKRMRAYHFAMILMAINNKTKYNYLLQYMNNEIQKHVKYCDKKNLLPILRVHGAGDIFNRDYLQFILNIASDNKNINVYTYTKQLKNDEIDKINNAYKNLNIIKSLCNIKNKYYINFGDMDYLQNLETKLQNDKQPCFICSYGLNKEIQCGVNCMACLQYSNVLFLQH